MGYPFFSTVRGGIWAFVLFCIVICLFVPFTPKMPAPGVDSSWALGLNQAVAQGLAFGKDILFTLGPYSAIYTKSYHPATDTMMIWGSGALACSYWLALMVLLHRTRWWVVASWIIFLLTLVYIKDSLFFSYPILVGLIVYKQLRESCVHKHHQFLTFLLLIPLGLLPLIKGSLLILCGLVSLFNALLFLVFHRYWMACFAIVIPVASLLGFWVLAGQEIIHLYAYISSTLSLAFAFTETMSTMGNVYEIIGYIMMSLLILYLIAKEPLPKSLLCFLLALFSVFLFLSFKAGFVRHFGHALIPATSILIAALLLPFCVRSKWTGLAVILALTTSLYIEGQYTRINFVNNIHSTYSAAWYGLGKRLIDSQWLRDNFLLTMNYFKAKNALPKLSGTSDIYSYDQTDLIASGNKWSPRPVFQSYSVFNKTFAKNNEQHLLDIHRPDNVFFKIQPIDNRLPSLEDGASWPALLHHYRPKSWENGFLLLHKKAQLSASPITQELSNGLFSLGQTVDLPDSKRPLLVELNLAPTLVGCIVNMLFKPEELGIVVSTEDGATKQYRFIPKMAKAGFMLSPLVENTRDFSTLYGDAERWHDKRVLSFQIVPSGAYGTWLWNSTYKVNFKYII